MISMKYVYAMQVL